MGNRIEKRLIIIAILKTLCVEGRANTTFSIGTMAPGAYIGKNLRASERCTTRCHLGRQTDRRIGFPSSKVGHQSIDFLITQRTTVSRPKGGHAKIWLTMGNDVPQGKVIPRLEKFSRANGNNNVIWIGWIRAAFAKLPMTSRTILCK